MANAKISQLTGASTPLAGTEVVPLVQGGTTKKVSVADLTAGRAVSALSYSAGNLNIAGNAITSSSGAVDLRPASSGFATIGAAASASWASSFYGLSGGDIYSVSTDGSNSNTIGFASNAYRTASGTPGSWAYAASATATLYVQDRGRHNFYSAASGTANNTITWVPVISTAATGGDVTVNTGNLVQGTAAKGVNFTANTPAAGMTSQLLNWYEEGTWTPTQGSGLIVVGAFTSSGTYTRVGRIVTLSGRVQGATSVAVSAGGIITSAVPWQAASTGTGAAVNSAKNASATTILGGGSFNLYSVQAVTTTTFIDFTVIYSV